MRMMNCLELADADQLIEVARIHAQQTDAMVSIAVVDAAGLLITFRRLDGASAASVETSAAKARTAALTGSDSSHAEQAISSGLLALVTLQGVLHQHCALMAGGLVLRCEGDVVVAIGVSGITPDEDSAIARAGLEAFEIRDQGCSS